MWYYADPFPEPIQNKKRTGVELRLNVLRNGANGLGRKSAT